MGSTLMTKLSVARRVALHILGDVRRRCAYARDVLRASERMRALDGRDRAFVSRLVLGVTASVGQLDELIDARLHKPSALEPQVRDALRLSVFELVHLAQPVHVSVSQGVELVRHINRRAPSLANAVLRQIAEVERPAFDAAREACARGGATRADLLRLSALPEWLFAAFERSLSTQELADLCTAQLEPAPVWVHINPSLADEEQTRARLEELLVTSRAELLKGCYMLESPARLGLSGLVDETALIPCDLAAQLICAIALPAHNSHTAAHSQEQAVTILEIGQGRATKSAVMLSMAQRVGLAYEHCGIDVSAVKVKLAQKRLETGMLHAHSRSFCLDGRCVSNADIADELRRKFDTVLLDVPCSGTGTLRRHPEICWSLDEASIDPANPVGLPAIQLQMLKAAAARVKRGGSLCYATCSLLPQENEAVVDAFLASAEGEGFDIAPVSQAPQLERLGAYKLIVEHERERGFFHSYPKSASCDGHFCARLVRSA